MTATPTVSIIIPTFNRASLLQQTLDSLSEQTLQDWEALIVDDGSEDSTAEIMRQRCQQDPRIKYIQRSSRTSGAPACRNEGTRQADGQYILYLDADDYLAPYALRSRVTHLDAHSKLDFAVFHCALFRDLPGDTDLLWNIKKDVPDLDRFLGFDMPWQTMCPLWRRETIEKLGSWREDLPSWQDFEFHVRVLTKGFTYQWFDDTPDCFWRLPKHGSIGDKSRQPHHLKSHESLLADIQNHLAEANLLTQHRQRLLRGIYFWLMDAWAYQGNAEAAHRVWQLCKERNLIEPWLHEQAKPYITASTMWVPHQLVRRLLRNLTRRYIQQMSKNQIIPIWSTTFRKSPMTSAQKTSLTKLSKAHELV